MRPIPNPTSSRLGRLVALLMAVTLCLGQTCTPPPDDPNGNQNDNPANDDTNNDDNNDDSNDDDQDGADNDTTAQAIPPSNTRVAFSSQCALNVIQCTTVFPVPKIDIQAEGGQTVETTSTGFRVTGSDGDGSEYVQFIGADSEPGNGATALFYSWSYGATDANVQSLSPGAEFSTSPNPRALLAAGLHYIRLTLENDVIIQELVDDDGNVVDQNVPASDFLEIEVEVVD